MEILLYKDSTHEFTYYLNSDGLSVRHGEYKGWYSNGQIRAQCFYMNGKRHGEYKDWHRDGEPWDHYFFIHGKGNPVIRFNSEEDKLLFQLEHPDFRFLEE